LDIPDPDLGRLFTPGMLKFWRVIRLRFTENSFSKRMPKDINDANALMQTVQQQCDGEHSLHTLWAFALTRLRSNGGKGQRVE
jgi:hypothetical protein